MFLLRKQGINENEYGAILRGPYNTRDEVEQFLKKTKSPSEWLVYNISEVCRVAVTMNPVISWEEIIDGNDKPS